jgi:UDP-N-acetylmuramate--alanine ligase
MIKPDYSQAVPENLGSVHFIGIGGSGMSGIAKLLIEAGYSVSGSDVRDSANVATLKALGARIAIGHDAKNLGDAQTVVVTSALWPNNPELLAAKERNLPVLHRSALLAHLASSGRLIAIAGAHGKTTSTGMVITGLKHLGVSPSFVNGGVIHEFGASAAHGKDDIFVIEADESDSSFLHYKTAIALITNVDPDHLDHFGSLEAFEAEFRKFAIGASDFVAISADDPGAIRVSEGLEGAKIIRFGFADNADFKLSAVDASGPKVSFSLAHRGETASAQLAIAGEHNAVNAAGAVAVLTGLGFDFKSALAAVARFAGTQRRFEFHGSVGEVSVFDDFAHHPAEVVAALKAARAAVGSGRLITVFQPHLFSRTRIFASEFALALELSDHAVVTDIYAAREDPEPGVTGELITRAASAKLDYVPNWDDVPAAAAALAQPGDFIITMGCGDIFRMVPELLSALEKK